MEKIYHLSKHVFYFKDRNCVIKYPNSISDIKDEILPPIINRKRERIKRSLTTELIILLSYKCNLDCIYCSNNSGNSKKSVVEENSITKALAFVVKNALILHKIKKNRIVKPARVIVSGGGEPTVEWGLLTFIIDRVNEYKVKYGNDIIELSILTNGQINEENADYIINNFNNIFISCDGISVQDKQRMRRDGKSSKVYIERLLEKLEDANKKVSIRMTVTGEALPSLKEDVEYLFCKYKGIKNIIIEPYAHIGRGESEKIKKLDYHHFVTVFDEIVRMHYDSVYNSATLLEYCNMYPCQRLAGISLVLSPYNVITCCDTVTPESELWDSMIMATIDDEKIKMSKEYTYSIPKACESCIALEFCAGGCPMHLNDLAEFEKEQLCKYRQEMMKSELLRRIDLSKKTKKIHVGENECFIYELPRGEI